MVGQERRAERDQQQRNQGRREPADVQAVEAMGCHQQKGGATRQQAQLLLEQETPAQRHLVELFQGNHQDDGEKAPENAPVPDETEDHNGQESDSGQGADPEIIHLQQVFLLPCAGVLRRACRPWGRKSFRCRRP